MNDPMSTKHNGVTISFYADKEVLEVLDERVEQLMLTRSWMINTALRQFFGLQTAPVDFASNNRKKK